MFIFYSNYFSPTVFAITTYLHLRDMTAEKFAKSTPKMAVIFLKFQRKYLNLWNRMHFIIKTISDMSGIICKFCAWLWRFLYQKILDLADIYRSLGLKIEFCFVFGFRTTYYLNFFFWRTLQIPKFTRLYLNRRKTERNYFQNRYRQYWFGEFHNFAISIVNLRSIALDMSANIKLYVVKLCTYKRRLRITQISSSWDTN